MNGDALVVHNALMQITIRCAETSDADGLAAAHIEGWRTGYRGVVSDEYLDGSALRELRLAQWRSWSWAEWRPLSSMYSALLDGDVVGFGHVGEAFDANEQPLALGEVYGFYIHPRAWGTGVAAALMARCEGRLIESGFREALLYALRDNPRGRRFYEKSGWEHDPTGDGVFEASDGLRIADVRYVRRLPVG